LPEVYYQPGEELTSLTTPSSASYVEQSNSVEITSIEKADNLITLLASIVNIPTINLVGLEHLEALATDNTITAVVDSNDEITKVTLSINGELIGEDIEAPYQFDFSSSEISQGLATIDVAAYTEKAKGATTLSVLKLPSEVSLMAINLTNDDTLEQTLDNFLKPVLRMTDVAKVPPDMIPAIFVISHNYELLTNEQFNRLVEYVNSGGHLYYENTDWYFNRALINTQWQALGIESTSKWSQTAAIISGIEGSIVADLSYSTPEGYFLFNELTATASNNAGVNNLWQTDDGNFSHAVSHTIEQSKIIATTGKYSWLPNSLSMPVMSQYLDFFGLDNAAKPVEITIESDSEESFTEGDHTIVFTISRSYDNGTDSSVNITIESDNTIEGADYLALESNQVSFASGELNTTIELTLLDNLKVDGDKELYVTLSGDNIDDNNASNTSAYIFIEDNEHRGALQFKESSVAIAENSDSFTVTVQRIGGVDEQIDFTIASINGTAIAGTDYQEISETLTFEQYDTEKTFTIYITDNSSYAVDKTFSLEISSDYLTGVLSQITVTINNDEPAPIPVVPVTAEKSSSGGATSLVLFLLLLVGGYRYRASINRRE
jgi:hypothetical protein